jgi:hypothetical protein
MYRGMSTQSELAVNWGSKEEFNIPDRSHLYSLEPLAHGTGGIESASSYLSRLAMAHTVSTWSLLKCEIGPQLFGEEATLRYRLGELVTTLGAAFNGENGTSRALVSILQGLTGRTDLARLTMGFCRGFVSPRYLVQVKQAWCGECLSEWKSEGRELYSPLLWHLMAATVCPKHGSVLRTACPKCDSKFHPLTAHSRPGYCPRCGTWLGVPEHPSHAELSDLGFEQEIAQKVSDFLGDGPELLAATKESCFPGNIQLLVEQLFDGNVAALSRFLKVNRYTIIAWKAGVQRPTLLSLADVSLKVSVPPAVLLCKQLQANDFQFRPDAKGKARPRRFFPPKEHDLEKMRRALEDASKEGLVQRISLSQLARRLGCDQTTLDNRFPELARRVKDLYKEFCAVRKAARAKELERIVRQTTIDIYKAGDYPSQYRVRQALPSFIDMRDPPANDAWKRTLIELQLDKECEKDPQFRPGS